MVKEYPNWKVKLIDLESLNDWPYKDIFRLPPERRGHALAYRRRKWYRQQLVPVCQFSIERKMYKTGGVYIVIGGSGGVGEVWSEYMIRNDSAQIVWIGRRSKDNTIQAKLDRLAAFGTAPKYICADAADKNALISACKEIKGRYSKIDGIVHSAVAFWEQRLDTLEEETFKAGLAAKIDVSVNLAQVFKMNLWILYCFSLQLFHL
jgi:hypothetical protein